MVPCCCQGEGGFSSVHKCVDHAGTPYALKRCFVQHDEHFLVAKTEVDILKRIQHPNIIRCVSDQGLGWWKRAGSIGDWVKGSFFQGNTFLSTVLGSLAAFPFALTSGLHGGLRNVPSFIVLSPLQKYLGFLLVRHAKIEVEATPWPVLHTVFQNFSILIPILFCIIQSVPAQ